MPAALGANEYGDRYKLPAGISISELSGNPEPNSSATIPWQANWFIGPYQLIEAIGAGGMGEVWLAEQTRPVRRRVALKLIKAGMDTAEVVARFASERQALALMDHPGIAKVLDAGATPQGRPYFAMEYITGTPITQYCDQHRLTLRQRLQLFVQVCEAVQHAHQKAVIHRDLKPSNILVSEVDGKPAPRIIDFGVAKALSQSLTADSELTQVGMILGTPAYMSPEQASSSGVDVDTRTDVYSLGVVLYELLVGVRPLDFEGLPLNEMLRRSREAETPRPSTKLRALGNESSFTAEERGSDLTTLARQLRGDLDAIALKALEKDRSRRYGTPSELAADILRYLNNQAVLAVAPSLAYRGRKFARRHRDAMLIACAFTLVLVVAAAVSIRQRIVASRQRDRADAEAAVSRAVNDFLQNDLLAQAGPRAQWRRGGVADPDLKVRAALDRAAASMAGKFDGQPEVEASIRDTVGEAYIDLGLTPKAQKQLERALDLYLQSLGPDNPKTLRTKSRLAEAAYDQGRYADAAALFTDVLKVRRRVLGPAHPETIRSMYELASNLCAQGEYPPAEGLLASTIDSSRRVFGGEDPRTLDSMDKLAEVYFRKGNFAQAEALARRVVEIRRRIVGPENPDTTISMNTLANASDALGRFSQAGAIYKQIWEIRRRAMGAEHPFTLGAPHNLAIVYSQQGRYSEAESLDRQTLEIRRRTLGLEDSNTLLSMDDLANDYSNQKKYSQAEALFASTIEIARRVLGLESWVTLEAISDAVHMHQREGKYAVAEKSAAEVLAVWRRNLGRESSVTAAAANDLVLAYLSQKEFVASVPLAREVFTFYRNKRPDDWQRFRAESLLGASLSGQKEYAEAEPLLLEGYRGMMERKDRIGVPDWYHLNRARQWIVELYRSWGSKDKAAKWNK